MRPLTLMISLAVLAPLAACSKKQAADPGPSCDVVVDNMMKVTKEKLAGHGDLQLQNRAQMIQQCQKRDLSAAQRTCLAGAADLGAIATCTPRPTAPPQK